MEAHGHEEIGTEVSAYLRSLIKSNNSELYNSIYGGTDEFIKNQDPVHRAFYLGNWLTDNTQIFAPDFVYEVRSGMQDAMLSYNTGISHIFNAIGKAGNFFDDKVVEIFHDVFGNVNTKAKNKKAFKKYLRKNKKSVIQKIAEKIKNIPELANKVIDIDEIFDKVRNFYRHGKKSTNDQLRKVKERLLIPPEFIHSINKEKAKGFIYDKRGRVWELQFSILKYKGYLKFCKEYGMDFSTYKNIIENFIERESIAQNDKKTNSKFIFRNHNDYISTVKDEVNDATIKNPDYDRFIFKMNQYYPSDHLDRAFTRAEIDSYKKDKINRKADFVDWSIDNDNKIYSYLKDYIDITSGKITTIAKDSIIPCVFENNKINNDEFLLQVARLGHSLHAVEDFFAHSNFIELNIRNLNYQVHPNHNRNDFFTNQEFENKFKLNEKRTYYDALKKTVNRIPNPNVSRGDNKEYEDNLVTGWFAEGGMPTSIYHLAFGSMVKKLREANFISPVVDATDTFFTIAEFLSPVKKPEELKYIQSEKLDAIHYLIQNIYDIIDGKRETQLREKIAKLERVDETFSADLFDFIFYPESKNAVFNQNEIDIIRTAFIVMYDIAYGIAIASEIIKIIKTTKELNILLKILLGLLVLFFAPEITPLVMYYICQEIKGVFYDILGEVVYKAIEKTLNYLISKILITTTELLGLTIETFILNTHSKENYGSHSIVAKDEEYHREHTNSLALRTATFMDKLILAAIFDVSKDSNGKVDTIPNIPDLIYSFLKHPMHPSNAEIVDKDVVQPDNYTKNIRKSITSLWFNDTNVSIYDLYRKGLVASALNEDDYNELFKMYNIHILEEDIQNKTTTLQQIISRNKDKKKDISSIIGNSKWAPTINSYINQDTFNIVTFPNTSKVTNESLLRSYINKIDMNKCSYPSEDQFYQALNTTYCWALNFFNKENYPKNIAVEEDFDLLEYTKDQLSITKNEMEPVETTLPTKPIKMDVENNILEDKSLIKLFLEHFDMNEYNYGYAPGMKLSTINDTIKKSREKEIALKQKHEEFLTEFYKKQKENQK